MSAPQWVARPFGWGAATAAGLKRACNQDALVCNPRQGLFAVVDGIGGLPGGEQAARTIQTEWPVSVWRGLKKEPDFPAYTTAAFHLKTATEKMSDTLYLTLNAGGKISFGAGMCGVWLLAGAAVFINMGDCRGYFLKKGETRLRQITQDHTIGQKMVQEGFLSPGKAMGCQSAHSLTKYVGMQGPAAADSFIEETTPGDSILLCSDGVYNKVADEGMAGIILAGHSPQAVCGSLLKTAQKAGSRDDVSAIYIQL